jgi:hypothetical protein
MTSGNIRMGPDPDEVREALEKALKDDPSLRDRAAEDVASDLLRRGYLEEAPDPVLVAEMLGTLEPDGPGEETEEASPT